MPGLKVPISGPVPVLLTHDMRGTIAFYCDTLGFELTNSLPSDEPTWCFLRRDSAAVMYLETHDHEEDDHNSYDHDHDEGDHHHGPPGMNALSSLYFYAEDVNALWEQLRDKTAVVHPLENMDYGMREFTIRDSNGYALNFGKSVEG